jgi:Lar family restriction alleviation protein
MISNIPLKPCPFCGGEAYLEHTGGHYSMAQVHCGNHSLDGCGASGPQGMDDEKGVAEVCSHWNRRT